LLTWIAKKLHQFGKNDVISVDFNKLNPLCISTYGLLKTILLTFYLLIKTLQLQPSHCRDGYLKGSPWFREAQQNKWSPGNEAKVSDYFFPKYSVSQAPRIPIINF